MQQLVYPAKFQHYDFQKDMINPEMEYFPYDVHDLIKVLSQLLT